MKRSLAGGLSSYLNLHEQLSKLCNSPSTPALSAHVTVMPEAPSAERLVSESCKHTQKGFSAVLLFSAKETHTQKQTKTKPNPNR